MVALLVQRSEEGVEHPRGKRAASSRETRGRFAPASSHLSVEDGEGAQP
jgi:hypothetical protein